MALLSTEAVRTEVGNEERAVGNFTKGAVVMAGFMSQALGALFKENEQVVTAAKTLAGVAACRVHRVECATNLMTGERVCRWQIEFDTEEDAVVFDASVRALVDAVTGEEK